MGYLTDPKTGKRMKAEDFVKRERKEWGQALGVFAKECFGAGKSGGKKLLIATEKDLIKMLGSAHNFKRR
ncbi:MAG: hypothetical protein GY792_10180 [Gammaproteobacteria bacterium]|nr:hypothetical protein [Gammaproteobacteria bacterium]